MRRILKRALSVLLAVTMIFGTAAFGFSDVDWSDFAIKAKAATSGKCGANLTWTFDTETDELTISGTGDMWGWGVSRIPWYSYISRIKSVSINNGVTSIGSQAFSGCESLVSIAIPNSVTRIDSSALSSCYSLTSITIPDSVTSIGDGVFASCRSLINISIPDSVTSIGKRVFRDCDNLTSIFVDSDNTLYSSDEYGVLFNKAKTELIQYPIGNERTSYTIPDSVTIIGDWAFRYCDSITSVTTGNSVTSIGDDAFSNCDSLTSVTIPNSVTKIGRSAFAYCDSLISVVIPDRVTKIYSDAFDSCDSLTSIIVNPDNASYSSDEYGVLFNKDKTELIKYPLGNTRTNYTIPDAVENIGMSAFRECVHLISITIPDNVKIIDKFAFMDCDSLTRITIPESVIGIMDWAFVSCDSLVSVRICNGVYGIVDFTFGDCINLTSIVIPTSIKHIYEAAFSGCDSLSDVFYAGSEAEWDKIIIDPRNSELKYANIHYSSGGKTEIDFGKGTVEVFFEDKWFEQTNTQYNHSLGRFCADYVMLGYCYNEAIITDYLSEMGFGNVDTNMHTERDEVNYFIASKDIIINGKAETLVFAAFIGSFDKQWYSNFDPYGTERETDYAGDDEKGVVHLGFADAREYVYAKLEKYLENNKIEKDRMKLLLSGHSRGAATANLLAAKLIDEDCVDSSASMVSKDDIYTYTFATPNNASKGHGINLSRYNCIFNVINPEDFVTKVLLGDWGYGRYGKTFVLPSKKNDEKYEDYLKEMKPLFMSYCGNEYDPYKMGEVKTYNIIKSLGKNVSTLEDLYNKEFTYFVSFDDWDIKTEQLSTFEFFKRTLLEYIVNSNTDEIFRIIVTCSLFYKNIIQYFAWPDIDGDKVTEAIISKKKVMDGIALGGKFEQAHQMETYAAYMNSMTGSQIQQYREAYKNTVNCPVDIEVYNNATDELVGKITNNTIDETVAAGENAVVMDIEGDSKSFWLPSNGDYRIVLTGNDEGTMDYSVSSIDSDTGETQRVNFFDVEIENGVSMEGELGGEEFTLDEYTLTHEENGTVEPDEKLDESELRDISVNITTEGIGYTDGNITVISGDYVTLNATTYEGNSFIGWYENGTLVSADAEYSFVAKENRNLVAKFTSNYSIQWDVDGEITVTYCEEGTAIAVPTPPEKEGYRFVGWTPEVPEVMPAEDLVFTAVFEEIEPEIPEEPSEPTTEPITEPTTVPEETTTQPVVTEPATTTPVEVTTTQPITEPSTTQPTTVAPTEPATELTTAPEETTTKPVVTEPATTTPVEVTTTQPATEPSTTQPTTVAPTEPATEPTTAPEETTTQPVVPEPDFVVEIRKPSQTEIKYGDSIVLHAEVENLPEGAKIEWSADNGNFTIVEVSADGMTCRVTPASNGDTVFTAKVVDTNGNEVVKDEQTMTSKAGFFRKIIAFFKKLFGLTEVIPEVFKGII